MLKHITLVFVFVCGFYLSASDMDSVLEVGRENSTLSAVSQDKIDSTEKQTDKHADGMNIDSNRQLKADP